MEVFNDEKCCVGKCKNKATQTYNPPAKKCWCIFSTCSIHALHYRKCSSHKICKEMNKIELPIFSCSSYKTYEELNEIELPIFSCSSYKTCEEMNKIELPIPSRKLSGKAKSFYPTSVMKPADDTKIKYSYTK